MVAHGWGYFFETSAALVVLMLSIPRISVDYVFETFSYTQNTIETAIKEIIWLSTNNDFYKPRLGSFLKVLLSYYPKFRLRDPTGTLIEAIKGRSNNVESLLEHGLAEVTDEAFEALIDLWVPPEEDEEEIRRIQEVTYKILIKYGKKPSKESRVGKMLQGLLRDL